MEGELRDMHAIEKILARGFGLPDVTAGQIANSDVDLAGINDLYLQAVYSFREMGGEKVVAPEKVVVFLDHYAPASSIKQAQNHKEFREFCREQGIVEGLMDIHEGVCHQIVAEKGMAAPGKIIVITDSHTNTHGAFGAFGTGVGATDMGIILRTGKLWFKVPEIIKINLEGTPQKGVYIKDIILHIIGDLGADYAVYKAIELSGPLVEELSISERMCLCNMTTEMGAKTAYIQPDEITFEHLKRVGATDYNVYTTDDDYVYWAEHTYDVSEIEPQLAIPSSVDNVEDISKQAGTAVDQAFLGTCTGGRLDDIAVAAQILRGKKIHKDTRMLVVPASKEVFLQAIEHGYMKTLIEANATFVTPGCAACLGTHEGLIARGESCITTANRNFPGRMGHTGGRIYLASPAAVAASALEGKIADPRRYL